MMPIENVNAVRVKIWGMDVGAISKDNDKPGFYRFQYFPDFLKKGLELSPIKMPINKDHANYKRGSYEFYDLNHETYSGLPGLLSDALPDKFGNTMINTYMATRGIQADQITTLQRLIYIGRRSMGALEFEPSHKSKHKAEAVSLDMAKLVEDSRKALKGNTSNITHEIIEIGSSAGGARAKAVIGWNRKTNDVVSGQFEVPENYEHWLLKFDVGEDKELRTEAGFGRIEYAHYLMAQEAGVVMNECHLLEENGRAHFMTKRFDRAGNKKLHMQSLCGLDHLDFNRPRLHSYDQYFRIINELQLGAAALEQGWLRCAFNIATVNCDDHTKNFSFLMDEKGSWSLAPAYDCCFAHNPRSQWTAEHNLLVSGKTWNITAKDLLEVGARFDIKNAKQKLERVVDAVSRWPKFAATAGVISKQTEIIQSFHPNWVQPKQASKKRNKP